MTDISRVSQNRLVFIHLIQRTKKFGDNHVSTISSGSLPCMESAVPALAQIESSAAVQKTITHYDQKMSQRVQLPTETLQDLLDLHRTNEREAIKTFMENSFKDVDQVFLTKLEVIFSQVS